MPYAELGVECSDTLRDYDGESTSLSEVSAKLAAEKILESRDTSPHFGELNAGVCGVWPRSQRYKESFHGPWWNHSLSNDVLIITNAVSGYSTCW